MKKRTAFLFVALSLVVNSCNNNSSNEGAQQVDTSATIIDNDTTPKNEMAEFQWDRTMMSLPAPGEVLQELSDADLPFDGSLLNPVDNESKYQSSLKKSFNYGIYAVDLVYIAVNSRMPEMKSYYATVTKLASDLNVSETFDKYSGRLEDNFSNKDSLRILVRDMQRETDTYLRSNQRLLTAAQSLAGTWIEGQYITVNLLKNVERKADNEKIFRRVWEQRFYVDQICKIFDEYKDDTELEKIKNHLSSLREIYMETHNSKDITEEYLKRLSIKLNETRKNISG